MRFLYLTMGFLAALAAFSALYLMPSPQQSSQTSAFPEKLSIRLLLPVEDTQEIGRTIHYADDNETKLKADVEFADGKSGYVNFRPDGTVSTFGIFYPEVEDTPRQLKMEAAFAEDGIHYLWERHYFDDGALSRNGLRLASGKYQVEEFFYGGKTLSGKFVFDDDGLAEERTHYYPTGVVSKTVITKKFVGTDTTEFSEDGLKLTYHQQSHNGKEYVWETYQADGETPVVRYEQKAQGHMMATTYYIMATYYDDDGNIDHQRKFTRSYMTVYFLDENGDYDFRQSWKHNAPDTDDMSLEPDQWTLEAIQFGEEMDFSSESFWFADDGESIERHVFPPPGEKFNGKMNLKVYHPDGSLAQWRRPDAEGKFVSTKYEPGESDERLELGLLKHWHIPVPYSVPSTIPPKTDTYR